MGSVISGYIGTSTADKCNIFTTFKVWASDNFIEGLDIAMRSKCIMGFGLLSLGVAMMHAFIVLFRVLLPNDVALDPEFLCDALAGCGCGIKPQRRARQRPGEG